MSSTCYWISPPSLKVNYERLCPRESMRLTRVKTAEQLCMWTLLILVRFLRLGLPRAGFHASRDVSARFVVQAQNLADEAGMILLVMPVFRGSGLLADLTVLAYLASLLRQRRLMNFTRFVTFCGVPNGWFRESSLLGSRTGRSRRLFQFHVSLGTSTS
jgi:hypothetical protein